VRSELQRPTRRSNRLPKVTGTRRIAPVDTGLDQGMSKADLDHVSPEFRVPHGSIRSRSCPGLTPNVRPVSRAWEDADDGDTGRVARLAERSRDADIVIALAGVSAGRGKLPAAERLAPLPRCAAGPECSTFPCPYCGRCYTLGNQQIFAKSAHRGRE
jgi:hypothetical protein